MGYQLRLTSVLAGPDQIAEEFMTSKAFETVITETSDSLAGPWRRPHQMLNAQVYDSHASIHDDATAQKLGFQGRYNRGADAFQPVRAIVRELVGKCVVRDWMYLRALSQSLLRGRRGAGHS